MDSLKSRFFVGLDFGKKYVEFPIFTGKILILGCGLKIIKTKSQIILKTKVIRELLTIF